MASLPALTRAYWARGNIPFGAFNTTQLELEGFYTWMLSECLLDLATTGTTSTSLGGPARPANSIYICRGSSDGVGGGGAVTSVGVAGTNRWHNGGVFPGLVRGSNGANHHWMLVENVTLGMEILINFSQNAGYVTIAMAPSGTFSGGSATNFPTPSNSAIVVCLAQTGYNGTDAGQYNIFGDYSSFFGGANRVQFCVAPNGEFWYGATRVGLGVIYNIMALWKTTGQQVGDSRNFCLISSDSTVSGRGGLQAGRWMTSSSVAMLTPSGAQKSAGGAVIWANNSSSMIGGYGVDALSAEYLAHPIQIVDLTPSVCRRGLLPDIQIIGAGPIGSSIPDSATQERTIIGDGVFPFPLVNIAL